MTSLHDRSAPIGHYGLVSTVWLCPADDDVYPGTSAASWTSAPSVTVPSGFLRTPPPWSERDHHIDFFGISQHRHRSRVPPRRIGKGDGRVDAVNRRFASPGHQKCQIGSPAFNDKIVRMPLAHRVAESASVCAGALKSVLVQGPRRTCFASPAAPMAAAVPSGPRVKSWFPKVVASQPSIASSPARPPSHELRRRKRYPMLKSAGIEHQNRSRASVAPCVRRSWSPTARNPPRVLSSFRVSGV